MMSQPAPKLVRLDDPSPQAKKLPFVLLAILIFLLGSASVLVIESFFQIPQVRQIINLPNINRDLNFVKFDSLENFKSFLAEAPDDNYLYSFGNLSNVRSLAEGDMSIDIAPKAASLGNIERVSTTNVQIAGVDEPDIAKTNGQEIFFSPQQFFAQPITEFKQTIDNGRIAPPPENFPSTKVIRAYPPQSLSARIDIPKNGELLLSGNTLAIFTNDGISGYNIANPSSPQQMWTLSFENNHQLTSARLYQGKIYFITQRQINQNEPCPISPLLLNSGQKLQIDCKEIYHPVQPVPVDTTYSVFVLNPQTGQISQSLSFIGSIGQSIVFMSPQALYVTYSFYQDIAGFYYQFFQTNSDLFPQHLMSKVAKIKDYDLSSQTKMMEIQNLLAEYFASLDEDEQLRAENEFANRMDDFGKSHVRDLEKTQIVKIGLGNLSVLASGEIPGQPLNQFSLDEYQDHLRVATTLGQTGWSAQTANDLYVLDKQMTIVGKLTDLGVTERIYAARFIGERGYLVTFRETDPFYVVDLSRPSKPEVKGELKIPGYSSYLHPLDNNLILGVGREGSQVKLSLFDVSRADNPAEVGKYSLNEYWSEILDNHHAFLLDAKHQIFFLPTSQGGYIFEYNKSQLSLKRTVAGFRTRRALYINDFLYMLGDNQVVVLDENNWEEINKLQF